MLTFKHTNHYRLLHPHYTHHFKNYLQEVLDPIVMLDEVIEKGKIPFWQRLDEIGNKIIDRQDSTELRNTGNGSPGGHNSKHQIPVVCL